MRGNDFQAFHSCSDTNSLCSIYEVAGLCCIALCGLPDRILDNCLCDWHRYHFGMPCCLVVGPRLDPKVVSTQSHTLNHDRGGLIQLLTGTNTALIWGTIKGCFWGTRANNNLSDTDFREVQRSCVPCCQGNVVSGRTELTPRIGHVASLKPTILFLRLKVWIIKTV